MVARVALLVSFPLPLTQWVTPLPLSTVAGPDFVHGLRQFLTSVPLPDAMVSASVLGYSKTELSRGIDLLHSLSGASAPALSWICLLYTSCTRGAVGCQRRRCRGDRA